MSLPSKMVSSAGTASAAAVTAGTAPASGVETSTDDTWLHGSCSNSAMHASTAPELESAAGCCRGSLLSALDAAMVWTGTRKGCTLRSTTKAPRSSLDTLSGVRATSVIAAVPSATTTVHKDCGCVSSAERSIWPPIGVRRVPLGISVTVETTLAATVTPLGHSTSCATVVRIG